MAGRDGLRNNSGALSILTSPIDRTRGFFYCVATRG